MIMCCVEHVLRAFGIRAKGPDGVLPGRRHMCLSRQMVDHVGVCGPDEVCCGESINDVGTSIGTVDGDHLVTHVDQVACERSADESGAAGDQ